MLTFRTVLAIAIGLAFTFAFTFSLPTHAARGGGRGQEFAALGERINEAQRAGDLALAEDLARQRLSVAQGGPERMLGNAYRNLGSILRLRGKLADAEVMLLKALPIIEKENGRNSFQAIRTLFNLGALYTSLSRYAEAQGVLRDALERQLAVAADGQDTIQAYVWLANVERLLGHNAESEALLKTADATGGKAIAKDNAHDDEFALQRLRLQTAFRYAQLRYQQGRYAESAEDARRSMAGFEKLEGTSHLDYANAQTQLGLALLQLGRLDEAESVLRAAVSLDERVFGRAHRETGHAAWALALTLQKNGKPGEAEPQLQRAIESARNAGASSQQALAERSYGRFLVEQKRLAEALPHYRQALDLIDRMFAHTQGLDDATREGFISQFAPYYRETLQLMLRLHHQTPQAGHDRESLAIVSRTQSRLFTEMLRKSDAGRHSADPAFVTLRQRQNGLHAQLAELQRARAVLGHEAQENDDGASSPPSSRRPDDPIIMERVAARRKELDGEIDAANADLTRTEDELRRKYPRYMELTQPKPVTVEVLQKTLLKAGETLLSYYMLPDRVLLFLVETDKYRLFEIPRKRSEIAALIAAARRPEETAGSAAGNLASLDPQVLFDLYRALVQPAVGQLKPGQRLLVVGDGPIHTLPLEMLIDRWGEPEQRAFAAARAAGKTPLGEYAGLSYLAGQYHFAYLPSLSALASIRLYRKPAVRYDKELVSFADPVFEKQDYSQKTRTALATITRSVRPGTRLEIPRLPETTDEAREIAAILGGRSDLFLREQAQEHTAKTLDLKTTRYLHFATHGLLGGEFVAVRDALTANEQTLEKRQRNLAVTMTSTAGELTELTDSDQPRPLQAVDRGQPALLLSLSGDLQGEDGLLTMGEVIESLDINARLVVLSACNTAGESQAARSGEGFAGLTRAFMYAGAQGILVSHWSVESRATQMLMTELFRDLHQGKDNLAALEHAREFIRTSSAGNLSHAHPYFWAPFVYVGD